MQNSLAFYLLYLLRDTYIRLFHIILIILHVMLMFMLMLCNLYYFLYYILCYC